MDKDLKALIAVGRLVSGCAGLEYYMNLLIEQTFVSPSIIDTVQRAALETRWNMVHETILNSRKKLSENEQAAIKTITAALDFYKKNAKDKRDIIAHSPLVKYGDINPTIVQSRRYKERGFNNLQIKDIEEVIPELQKHVAAMHDAVIALHIDPWIKTPYREIV